MRRFAALLATLALLAACSSGTPEHNPAEPEAGTPLATPATMAPPTADQSAALTQAAATTSDCRTGDPLANVYHPSRLIVVQPCITVTGRVAMVRKEDDGDLHIRLVLDAPFVALLNDRNRVQQAGSLVVEPVPADLAGCTPGQPPKPKSGTYDYGLCTGASLAVPAVGAHVSVTGPYVLDTAHGWMEVHPLWAWRAATDSGPVPTASPAGATATSAPGTPVAPASSTPGAAAPLVPTAGAAATVAATSAPPPAATITAVPSGGVRIGAVCRDGSPSSATGSGACSHHGGVAYWVYR